MINRNQAFFAKLSGSRLQESTRLAMIFIQCKNLFSKDVNFRRKESMAAVSFPLPSVGSSGILRARALPAAVSPTRSSPGEALLRAPG